MLAVAHPDDDGVTATRSRKSKVNTALKDADE